MLIVKCAHCGAGNRNVTETDDCFQCGNVLGAAPVREGDPYAVDLTETMMLPSLPAGIKFPQPAEPETPPPPVNVALTVVAALMTVAIIVLIVFLLR